MAEVATIAVFRQTQSGIQVLVGSRRKDSSILVLPGGKLDKGETPHAAAVRELQEETGIRAPKLTKLNTYKDDKKTEHAFCVKVEPDVKLIPDEDEDIDKLKWYSINRVPPLSKGHNVIVSEAVRKLFGNHLSGTFSDFLKKGGSGLLIVFEGLDGAGKSSQIEKLTGWLDDLGIVYVLSKWRSSSLMKKPIDKAKDSRDMSPKMFSLLHAADMIHRYEKEILPALEQGKVVICDRYWYTSMARDVVRGINPYFIRQMYRDFRDPDILFYCTVSASLSCKRAGEDKGLKHYSSGMDYTGAKTPEESCPKYMSAQKKVYDEELAKVKNMCKLDATQSIDKVFAEVQSRVSQALLVSQR